MKCCLLLLKICLVNAVTHNLLVADPLDLNLSPSDPSLSCSYSINVPYAQSCVTECLNSCGIHPGAARAWSLQAEIALCTNKLRVCAVPIGVHSHIPLVAQGEQKRHLDTMNFSPGGWLYRDTPSDQVSEKRNYRTQRVLLASRENLPRLVDPMHLTYVSLKRTAFAPGLTYKAGTFVSLVRNTSTNAETAWENDVGASMLLGSVRFRPSDKNESRLDLDDSAHGGFANSPNIAPLIQQWFLRYWEDGATEMPTLGIRSVAHLTYTTSGDITALLWDYQKKPDTRYELDTFSTFNWRAHVPPDCALRTDCASCTVHSLCSWCDMTTNSVPSFQMWAGWHANARTATLDGSACGVAPLVCAMMGGTPVTGLSCPREYDASLF